MRKKLLELFNSFRLARPATVALMLLLSLQGLSCPLLAQTGLAPVRLQERVYLHADRNQYLSGEIMWFKCYSFDADTKMPSGVSKIAYVELLNGDHQPVLQAKIALNQGSGSGSFLLPATLAAGGYQLRAYTNWMKNEGPEIFFEKNIAIINTLVRPEESLATTPKFDIQFFPEGGDLVAGLTSRVGFRAVSMDGRGVNFSGTIRDENNTEVAAISPSLYGIGSFTFTPVSGQSYTAVMDMSDGSRIRQVLPKAVAAGYVLRTAEEGSSLKISVETNQPSPNAMVIIGGHNRAGLGRKMLISAGKSETLIPLDSLAPGISEITLFSDGKPVAERLHFKSPTNRLPLKIAAPQSQFERRSKVTLTIDAGLAGVSPDASVAVFAGDEGTVSNDLYQYLWLNSGLNGEIENAGYYLSGAASKEAIDNLMLTHGWRRFKKDRSLASSEPEFLPEIEGHIIRAKVLDLQKNPAGGIMTYLGIPGRKLNLYAGASDKHGDVSFFTRDIFGPAELVVQTDFQRDSAYRIDIKNPFFEGRSANPVYSRVLNEKQRSAVLRASIANQVQNVFAAKKINNFYPAKVDSLPFYVRPDKVYPLDNYTRFNTMEEVIREYVTEVPLTRTRDTYKIAVSTRDHYNEYYKQVEPLTVFDGIPVFDPGTKIIKYDPKKVKIIEVMTRRYALGPVIFNSVIHFKSYKGTLPDFQLDSRATIADYDGMQLSREFFSPVYETNEQRGSRTPDFRNLLFWTPNVLFDSAGKATVSFYTSDQQGGYRVNIQGITNSGLAGSASAAFTVR